MTVWLTATFILSSLTANVLPTAATSPIAALVPAPDTGFFRWAQTLFGPLSLAESRRIASASPLDFLPADRSGVPPLAATGWLILATGAAGVAARAGAKEAD